MADGASYVVQFRRKREGRTDYKKRLDMLKSRKPRLVIRRTASRVIAQVIEYSEDGDRITCSTNSKELAKYGWNYSGTSLPAAYLTGFLCAKKSLAKGRKEAVMDLGLQMHINGSRIYSALKGAIDGGLAVPAEESVFPDEKRIAGQHIADYASKLAGNEKEKRFSGYAKAGADPKKIAEQFQEVKGKIEKDFKK